MKCSLANLREVFKFSFQWYFSWRCLHCKRTFHGFVFLSVQVSWSNFLLWFVTGLLNSIYWFVMYVWYALNLFGCWRLVHGMICFSYSNVYWLRFTLLFDLCWAPFSRITVTIGGGGDQVQDLSRTKMTPLRNEMHAFLACVHQAGSG